MCKTLFLAEHLGGVFYDRFSADVDNGDVAGTFSQFAGDEHHHAGWYADWLRARGHEPPNAATPDAVIIPALRILLAPQPLDLKLRTFAATEAAAERHLIKIAARIRDPELKAIVERTIPSERKHAQWYGLEGKRMLRTQDRK
ncbi:MAG TPA: ferritin family protein [Polyangiales bacterium]|nr:ferritin family protein [Polyangiales bacterium]